MKKLFHTGLILAVLLSVAASGCTLFTTEETAQSADGVQINSITLSSSGITMASAYKGITTQTLTASYAPAYASDTTISWTSSDTSVATVNATGTSVTVTAQGNGSSVITASSPNGSVTAQCTVYCTLETVAPLEVSSASITAYSNNAALAWTDPADSDGDLSYILIKYYPSADTTSVEETKADAGAGAARVTGLTGLTEYVFDIYAVDVDGNSSGKTELTATTTDEDTTNPEAVTSLAVTPSGTTAALTWTASTSDDAQYVLISASSTDSSASIPTAQKIASGTTSASVTGLSEGVTYTFSATVYDNNFNVSDAVTVDGTTLLIATGLSASITGYTGGMTVTWTDPEKTISKLTVTATLSGSSVTQDVASGVQTATFTGLTADSTYTFSIKTTYSDGTTTATSDSVTGTPVTIIKIINGYSPSTGYYFVPDITSSSSYYDIVCMTSSDISSNSLSYDRWIYHSALSGTSGYFSLEATDSTGTRSGYYLYVDPTRAMDSSSIYYSKWSYSATSYTHHAYVAKTTDSYFSSNLGYACFEYGSNTSAPDTTHTWKQLVWEYDTSYALRGRCLNVNAETSSTTSADYAWGIITVTE